MLISLTTLQKQSVSLIPKDVNGNPSTPIAGITYNSDAQSVASVQVTSADSLTLDIHAHAVGQANITAVVNPGSGLPSYTAPVATVNVALDPRTPGPSTHFDVVAN